MAVSTLLNKLLRAAFAAALLAPAVRAAETFPAATASYTLAFAPGSALATVVDAVREAKASIYVATYSFTSRPIALELLHAHKRGVQVFVVADEDDARERYSAVRFLANRGVPVRLNGRYAVQHNKFMVIDGQTVETGSFNYTTAAATRNAENVLVIRGTPQLARIYGAEWRRLWDEGTGLGPAY